MRGLLLVNMNYYEEIKNSLINNEVTKRIKDYSKNKSDLDTYYYVGKMLSEAGKCYGEEIIKEYSLKLSSELNIKYDVSSLNKMKKFYILVEKLATVSPILSYSHYVELLPYDVNKILYYIKVVELQKLSVRKLRDKIKSNEYERLSDECKNKLVLDNKLNISDLIKNPIMIRNNNNYEIINERILHKLIIEDISSFLRELGNGFSYIDNEYKIKLGDRYNYIDLLLFNIEFNCYVVVELKVVELKKEHIGQIQVYMNYIDENVKKIYHDRTIGLIVCRIENKYVIKYCSDERIIACEYKII